MAKKKSKGKLANFGDRKAPPFTPKKTGRKTK